MRAYIRAIALTFALPLAACTVLARTDASAGAPSQATWVTRQVDFTYQGFTTQYSCEGLRTNVETILKDFGARKDMHINVTPCAAIGTSEISFSPGVHGTVSVLVPATAQEISRHGPGLVTAHWKMVDLTRDIKLDDEHGGQCELLEQSKRRLLPLFTTRNLKFSSNCVPHETFAGGMTFKLEVLQADP